MIWDAMVWDIAAMVIWGRTLWQVTFRPASDYPTGWRGKILTLATVAFVWITASHWIVPLGALIVIWRRRRPRRPRRQGTDLPTADGWPGQ